MRSLLMMAALSSLFVFGCSTSPDTAEEKVALTDEAQATLNTFYTTDAGLQDFLKKSYAYVVFPSVGKGGVIVGGAYGRGVVYEQGKMIGWADLSQATVGAQLGGQTYSELVAFENEAAFSSFKTGKLKFAANASAVALKSGAAASAKYTDGVAVFVKPRGGLMFEASIGGQQLTFKPMTEQTKEMIRDEHKKPKV